MNDSNGVEWGAPPLAQQGHGRWLRELAPFVDRPGEWGKIPEPVSEGTASQLRLDAFHIPPGRWEFTHRSAPDLPKRRVWLYARYLGPETVPA